MQAYQLAKETIRCQKLTSKAIMQTQKQKIQECATDWVVVGTKEM